MTKARNQTLKQTIQMREIKMRFVYEGEVKGEYVNCLDAYENGFMIPNQQTERDVIRIEFEGEERPPRIRG